MNQEILKIKVTNLTQNNLINDIIWDITSMYTGNEANVDDFYFNICKTLQTKYLT